MLDALINIDKELLLLINGSGSETQDPFWLFISYKWSWVFFYTILLYLIYRSFGFKKTLLIMVGVAITITASDLLSVNLFKEQFERLRPCHQPSVAEFLRSVKDRCGGQFGFISSHASNTMALAFFLITTTWKKWGMPVLAMLFWSFVVGYSRIYLGVHYPTDVMAGFAFGGIVGLLCALGTNKALLKLG